MYFKIIDEREQYDSISIRLFNEWDKEVGYIDVCEMIDGYWWFDQDETSEEQYYSMIPDGKFILVQMVDVYPKFRRKGYANMMMDMLPKHLKQYFPGYNVFVLNASPVQSLPLNVLIEFYKKFGYEELIKTNLNCIMIKNS